MRRPEYPYRFGPTSVTLVGALALACGFSNPVESDLGPAAVCDDVQTWSGDWAAMEEDLAEAIASTRGAGGPCGDTMIGQTAVVEMSPELRCAARLHARYLGKSMKTTHEGKDGQTAGERIFAAEYGGVPRGQLIADRFDDAELALDAWLADPEQCAALRDITLDDVGVGVWQTAAGRYRWVVTLGTRRE